MFDWLLALCGVSIVVVPRTAVAEAELYRAAPGALVTACVEVEW